MKKFVLLLTLAFVGLQASAQNEFITIWNIQSSSFVDPPEIIIPTFPGEIYDYTVDWGDGTVTTNHNTDASHEYPFPGGVYTVKISGLFPRIYFEKFNILDPMVTSLTQIVQWGDNPWTSMSGAFHGTRNLGGNPSDVPNLSNVTDMSKMFYLATNFNPESIGLWDVSNVTNMSQMFASATQFDRNLGTWDVSNVTNMSGMFQSVTIGSGPGTIVFGPGGLSTSNYDSTLIAWSMLDLQSNVPFHGGRSKYCDSRMARDYMINHFHWTIIDSGPQSQNCVLCGAITEYDGGVWSNGFPDSSMRAIFKDDYDTILGTDLDVCSIEIKPGVTVSVVPGTVVKIANSILIEGELIFESDASGDGELGKLGPNAYIIGDAIVHRYFSANRSYRMVSPTITSKTSINSNWQEGVNNTGTDYPADNHNPFPGFGTHITGSLVGANGLDATLTGNPSLFSVNLTTQQFEAVTNTLTTKLDAGKSFLMMVRGDRSINMADPVYNPTSTVLRSMGRLAVGSQTQKYPVPTFNSWVMFGNPYQCSVDMRFVMAESNNVNTGYFYIYDATIAGQQGAYVTIQTDTGANSLPGQSDANGFLQPGQGAQAVSLVGGNVSMSFKEASKAPKNHTTTNATSNTFVSEGSLSCQLFTQENYTIGGSVHDGFVILFSSENDNELNLDDALKPMNFYENLGINHDGTYLSIEQREMPQPSEIISLYSSGYSNSNYTLSLKTDGLEETLLYLDDNYIGTSTLLEMGETIYNFSVDPNDDLSIATDRFSIRVEERLGIEDNQMLAGIRLYPNPTSNNNFYINAPNLNGEQIDVIITDMAGRQIFQNKLNCQDNKIAVSVNGSLTTGVYLVTLKFAGEESTYRLVKQ